MRLVLFFTTTYRLASFSYAQYQISGCNNVDCPTDHSGAPHCVLGNATTETLGIISFNTSLSPQLLTWTLIVQSLNPELALHESDFFLGTPPSLDLSQKASTTSTPNKHPQACSLFFVDMAPQLSFHRSDPLTDEGTCTDALNADCVADLQTQAKTELLKILQNNSSGGSGSNESNSNSTPLASSVCDTLSSSLRGKAPTSCTLASSGNWGSILSRPLISPQSPQPAPKSTCHPTTGGQDYELTLIAATQFTISNKTSGFVEAVYGVTPIMTVVYEGGDGRGDPNIEIDLSCLKAIETGRNWSDQGSTGHHNGTVGKGESKYTAIITATGLAFLSLIVLYWECL